MTNSETKEPKAKVNTRVWACKVNVNQKRPWQIIEVECWDLLVWSFEKVQDFWDGKTSSWEGFFLHQKEKKATLLIACVFWIVLGDQVVVVTLAEQRIADIPITPCNTHFECTFAYSPQVSLAR